MAKDGSTNVSAEEKEYTRKLPHGSRSPENADTASGGAPDGTADTDGAGDTDGEDAPTPAT
ncbi:MAG TPA: hypothetical protein VGC45_13935 [Gryllotalpicola sp.]